MDVAAATAFAGLSLAMAVGRFSGDWRRRKPGHFARNREIHC
jgi:hypothetical protein